MTVKKLFKPSVYRRIASAGDIIPVVPKLIQEYQTPKDEIASRINDVLVRIFNDADLHAAVRSYGKRIPFAQYDFAPYEIGDRCYNGFHHLALDPTRRMVLVRQELMFMTDETELNNYDLFQTENGIFYVQVREGTAPGEPREWKEGVLAANDIRGYEWQPQHDKSKLHTTYSILKSLEDAIFRL